MSEVRALIEELVSHGLDPVDAAEIVTRAAITGAKEATRSAGAKRQQRYRRQLDVPASRWEVLRREVFARDGYRCVYCECDVSADPQCDHVVPLLLGGTSDPDNLATACKACNSAKAGRHPDFWEGRAN